MAIRGNPIVQSMVPSQEGTRQNFPAPGQLGLGNWGFNLGRAQRLDWASGVDVCNDLNYFTKSEPHQLMKNSMFGPLSNPNLIPGEVNYTLNPMAQEQTNQSVNNIYKSTRVADNMSPAGVSRFPVYSYPNRLWYTVYQGRN